jgi:hypothetical protein
MKRKAWTLRHLYGTCLSVQMYTVLCYLTQLFIKDCPTCFEPIQGSSSEAYLLKLHQLYISGIKFQQVSPEDEPCTGSKHVGQSLIKSCVEQHKTVYICLNKICVISLHHFKRFAIYYCFHLLISVSSYILFRNTCSCRLRQITAQCLLPGLGNEAWNLTKRSDNTRRAGGADAFRA